MPPKMFTRIARTLRSARISRIAAATFSARAPPPMSRKFAGSPPARLTRSIVVIARPAPLTMQPIVPSSLMKLIPSARASTSIGSSSSRSRIDSSSGWRGSAESSSVTFASSATPAARRAPPSAPRSRTIASGLISTRSASFAIIVRTTPLAIATACLQVRAEAQPERERARLPVHAGRDAGRRGA